VEIVWPVVFSTIGVALDSAATDKQIYAAAHRQVNETHKYKYIPQTNKLINIMIIQKFIY